MLRPNKKKEKKKRFSDTTASVQRVLHIYVCFFFQWIFFFNPQKYLKKVFSSLSWDFLNPLVIQTKNVSYLQKQICKLQSIYVVWDLHFKNFLYRHQHSVARLGGSVRCTSHWWSGGSGFDPLWVWLHSFVEIYHEIFSYVILSLLLIQEGQLSVSGERMCTSTG